MRKTAIILTLLFLLTAVSCAEPTCEETTVEYRAAVDGVIKEWDDAVQIADNTARMNLAGPLAEMQSIKRDFDRLEVPECAETSHAALSGSMTTAIDGFLEFMSQGEDDEISRLFQRSITLRVQWEGAYAELTEPAE